MIEGILKSAYPADVIRDLLAAYKEIESNFALRKWKASELDAGHFVEAGRRFVEHVLFGSHTPIGTDLPKFTEAELNRYAAASGKADEFRILIPRVMWSIYGIRNKRGVAHAGSVSPNEMDATLILYCAKWVLAEFVRQASGLSPDKVQKAVDSVIERKLSVLWKHEGLTRVLAGRLNAKEKVLILLYDNDGQSVDQLRTTIEYQSAREFDRQVKELHRKRFVEHKDDGTCIITPKGITEAERLLRKLDG